MQILINSRTSPRASDLTQRLFGELYSQQGTFELAVNVISSARVIVISGTFGERV
jgi:hypothetical protein